MEIVFAVLGVIVIGYSFWQSYLLSQYKKIVDDQQEQINRLKPFQVLIATLRGGNFLLDQIFITIGLRCLRTHPQIPPMSVVSATIGL